MCDYVWVFDKWILFLMGLLEQVDVMLKVYWVYVKKVLFDDGDYMMDYLVVIYFMNVDNKFVGIIVYGEVEEMVVVKLQKLIGCF